MSLRSQIEFASSLQYAVRATDAQCRQKSARLRDGIKRGHMALFDGYAAHLAASPPLDVEVRKLFGPHVILVPAPGSARRNQGALWVPQRLCQAFAAKGLGARVEALLERTASVPKSAFAPRDQRPDAQKHYETIGVTGAGSVLSQRILIVDDIVTTGATLLASVSRLLDSFPNASVHAYAFARAISDGDIAKQHDPVRGTIRLKSTGRTWRQP